MLPPARLTCINPGLEHLVIPLNGNLPLVIGRTETLDQNVWKNRVTEAFNGKPVQENVLHPHYFPIPQPYVSRVHAFFSTYGIIPGLEHYVVCDVNSSNGVYLNGEKVESGFLVENNIVSFGSQEKGISFRFNYQK